MNGKTIRQSFAILSLGFVVLTTGCRNHVKEAQDLAAYNANRAAYEAAAHKINLAAYKAQLARQSIGGACYRPAAMVDVHTIDRALTYDEIRSQYNTATADEFVRQGLDR